MILDVALTFLQAKGKLMFLPPISLWQCLERRKKIDMTKSSAEFLNAT